MSGAAVLGDARAFARRGWVPPGLLDAALSLCDERLLQFLFEAGCDAGLDYRRLAPRLIAITFQHAAIQLSDDLSDGECSLLSESARLGPLLLMLLQNTFTAALAHAMVSRQAQLSVCAELARVGSGQLQELARDDWNFTTARQVASALNGRQLAAYFQIVWDGTPLAERAEELGMAFGSAVHVATDLRSHDPRLFRLDASAQRELLTWAARQVITAEESKLPSLVRRVVELRDVLHQSISALG